MRRTVCILTQLRKLQKIVLFGNSCLCLRQARRLGTEKLAFLKRTRQNCSNKLTYDLKKCVLLGDESFLSTEISSQRVNLEELSLKVEGGTHASFRNRKHKPCFYRVIQRRVEVWENEKCCGNTSRRLVFPELFRVLPNFHECFY